MQETLLKQADGILIPGGFGDRGSEGKIAAIRYARENRIPFFGICLGMQMAVVEFARHVCGLQGANSSEFDLQTADPVIHLMAEQKAIDSKGGTMRLGNYPCTLQNETLTAKLYGREKLSSATATVTRFKQQLSRRIRRQRNDSEWPFAGQQFGRDHRA